MTLLKEATTCNEQARAKVAAYGEQGSGKTTTLAMLAIAVSKTYHNGAPVAMFDTENGSDFIAPLFAKEGVKFFVTKSGAFADVVPALREAEQAGCCAFITDSATHIWNELVASYCARKAEEYKRKTYIPNWLTDARPIKEAWSVWTKAFLNSKLHCFVAGRAGMRWEKVPDENGKLETTPTGSRMKSEGEFEYEPNLLFEMETEREDTSQRKRGGHFVHKVHVLKDRARSLNGKTFKFPDINNYKQGDWKKIFIPFEPHFSFLNIAGTQRALEAANSQDLFDGNGNTEYSHRAKEKQIALDEILATMQLLWPGQSATEKQLRIRVMETIWGVRAWSAIEAMPLEEVQRGLEGLRRFEKQQPQAEGIDTENGILDLLKRSLSGDGTLHLVKESHTPVNLPPIPASQKPEDEEEEIAICRRNGSLVLSGSGTFRIKATLKNVYGGQFDRVRKVWTIDAKYEKGFKEVCGSLGIYIAEAAGAGA